MAYERQPFVSDPARLTGAVTRFAITACSVDARGRRLTLTLALEWEVDTIDGLAGPLESMRWTVDVRRADRLLGLWPLAHVETASGPVAPAGVGGPRVRCGVEARVTLDTKDTLRLEARVRWIDDPLGKGAAFDMDGPPRVEAGVGAGAVGVALRAWLARADPHIAGTAVPSRQADPFAAPSATPPADLFRDVDAPQPTGAEPPGFADPMAAPPEFETLAAPRPRAGPAPPAPRVPVPTMASRSAPAPVPPRADPQGDAAVFCPPVVSRSSVFLVQVLLYQQGRAGEALAQAQEADAAAARRGVLALPPDLPAGTRIDLRLEMPALRVDEPDAALVWTGATTAAQFEVAVPADAAAGPTIGRVRLSIAGVPAGTLRFQVAIAEVAAPPQPARDARADVQRYRRAFVSYSSKDRAEVLRRVQAFRIAGLEVFQDVLDLEPGQRWERELYKEIDRCDVLLLFWSSAAAASPWVAKEIDYALALQQGQDDRPPAIAPVPIEGPPIVPPPERLRHLHFNDALLAHIAAAR